ncbi:hypothetical protein Z946_3292 [Sulfitobacter noctilucicola]|uniref:Transferrin-binding protein B C-lobe/N-lobe beta barrel domain-containing protein n=1 Tax=Sulfitobacter noctilucicola TaxID=1342301 RepID=A0A7W6Q3Q0_9RHOB|nr:hypothetical protein [Sulfitobacter noctilucicola]KIN64401.1 hypothetical protein Z946_3292 [Sulfitobacter noctilucicola]MBB4174440.1 hypothetical protein [Sulfitobacter noctilucicola]
MKINLAGLMLCTFLVACGGTAPFGEETDVVEDGDEEIIESDRTVPPGTANPTSDDLIFRKEARDDEGGNGFATGVSYNSEDDTFSVDNLPFDGSDDTPYIRGRAVGSLGQYAVYEAVEQYPDSANGSTINQFTHRAIYGVSRSGQTEFAIVRSGAYVNYGFGGFVYQRNGDVDLPTTGQALYNGQGAGLRDYNGRGGLEYSTADVQIAIDFGDFNADTGQYEGAVDGFVFNRRIFSQDGTEITQNVLDRINEGNNASLQSVPTIVFRIGPDALDVNGEIVGTLGSRFGNDSGQAVTYEEGNYYGIISGDGANEIVGVIVAETGVDPSADNVRDTIGFTIYREDRE